MTSFVSNDSRQCSCLMRWLPCILLALLVVVVGDALGKDPYTHASFRSISLRDGEGRVRARIGVEDDGTVLLSAMDSSGRVRLRLGVHANGEPGVSLIDADGGSRLALALTEAGAPAVVIRDSKGTDRIVAALSKESAPSVTLSDSEGHARAALSVGSDDLPAWEILDGQELVVGAMRSRSDGVNVLKLTAPGGDTVELMAGDMDLCGVAVRAHEGQRVLRAGLSQAGETFGLVLEDASVRAQMGIAEGAYLRLAARDERSAVYLRGGTPKSTGMVLVDAEGHPRMRLAVSDGKSSISLHDPNQRSCLRGEVDEHGGRMVVTDAEGKTVLDSRD